jgi:hypothetical protein
VCRQIYAETTLLPFKLSEFYFVSEDSFDWLHHSRLSTVNPSNAKRLKAKLLVVRREAITRVRLITSGAEQMVCCNRLDHDESEYEVLPNTFPVHLFPGLKRIIIEARKLQPMRHPQEEITGVKRVKAAKTKLKEKIRESHKEVKIIFKPMPRCRSTGRGTNIRL